MEGRSETRARRHAAVGGARSEARRETHSQARSAVRDDALIRVALRELRSVYLEGTLGDALGDTIVDGALDEY